MQIKSNKAMKKIAALSVLSAAMMASSNSQACSAEPFISAVCIMALAGNQASGGFDSYVPAVGQQLSVSSYQALYSLVGNTYGGNSSSFNLPNLQGRFVVGAGVQAATGIAYPIGKAQDNTPTILLTESQLPSHTHALSSATSPISFSGNVSLSFQNVSFATSLSGVTAATTLANVGGSVDGSALQLYASHGGTTTNEPQGASLTLTTGSSAKIYSNATPSVSMIGGANGSIRGTAPVTFTGTPTTTLGGAATTIMVGTPTASVAGLGANITGKTAATGIGAAVNIMPSYIAMRYFIAVTGLYPVSNN
ncbi:hypothetical protein EJD96_04695 [Herbaspirillum seropedicae]|uniref:phage tail protein n=1 Tax=Herbaspirillum seropedicae TaxID=964 RepID=UPI00111F7F61|nr:tail fiber protein [Herbaspirillum seropedicae]QDD63495.1 hypothetical protein EJD96_04695 [Herbaspirillum seropedicae]